MRGNFYEFLDHLGEGWGIVQQQPQQHGGEERFHQYPGQLCAGWRLHKSRAQMLTEQSLCVKISSWGLVVGISENSHGNRNGS